MTGFKGIAAVGLILALLVTLTVSMVVADDNRMKQASALRDASVADFKAERYVEAAEKLRQAAAIYESLPEIPVGHLAVTLRALVWNEFNAGQIDECGKTFERLIELLGEEPDYSSELDSAWSAIFKAAKTKESFKEAEAFLARGRYAAANAGLDKLAAQITHSTASVAKEMGEMEASISYLEDAINQREEIGDQVGLAWSLNNLANQYLFNLNDLDQGMVAIVDAHAVVHAEGVLEVVAAVSLNLKKALEMAHEHDGKLDKILKGIDALIKQDEGSQVCDGISLPGLYRERLTLTEKAGKASKIQKAATAMTKAKLSDYPDEARADLAITATEAMIRAGKASKAKSWPKKVTCGEGPAAAHLTARLETVRAVIAAETKKKKDFIEHANKAAAAWEQLEDWQGERDALKALTDAAEAREYSVDIPDVTSRWNSIRGQGQPGGLGGSGRVSGDRSGYKDLSLTDTLFEITLEEGQIVLLDKVTEGTQQFELNWSPKPAVVNGLSLKIFGGYVVVEELNYGGSFSTGGAKGSARLSDLGDYLPVPATGALIIQKNGGIRYRR